MIAFIKLKGRLGHADSWVASAHITGIVAAPEGTRVFTSGGGVYVTAEEPERVMEAAQASVLAAMTQGFGVGVELGRGLVERAMGEQGTEGGEQ